MKRPEGFDPSARQPTAQQPAPKPRPSVDRKQRPPADPAQQTPERREVRARVQQAREDAKASAAAIRRVELAAARERRNADRAEVRRFTRATRRRRIALVVSAGVVVLLVAVLALAVYSPLLALRTIRVEGTQRLSAETLRSAMGGQLGTPLALVDSKRIHDELAAFPLIRSYVTEVVPPNTLVVHVVEREPVADVANGAAYDQVDPAGVVIVSAETKPSLPVIDVGTKAVTTTAFRSAIGVLLDMPATVRGKVGTITASTANDVSLTLRGDSQRVVWGTASDSALKARVLSRVLRLGTCKNQKVIDVSAPRAPVCGPE